jgi:hypothetical protein
LHFRTPVRLTALVDHAAAEQLDDLDRDAISVPPGRSALVRSERAAGSALMLH